MEVYTQTSTMVWGLLLGLMKTVLKKVLGRSFIILEALQTLVVKVEAVLNDRPLTHLSTDVTDPEPLTPSYLLYGWHITVLLYPVTEEDEISGPTFVSSTALHKKTER